ncbi:MAG: hypothetical protein AAF717_19965 [Bacteroidota bacterium]
MKKTVIVFFSIVLGTIGGARAQKSNLEIPPDSSLELDYADYEMYQLQLRNNNSKGLEVKVVNKQTGAFVRGFGLGPVGKVKVMVESTSKIVFLNTGNKTASLSVAFTEMDAKKVMAANAGGISFTLVNSSDESIPLIIPNVMNPNLSPNSKSRVDLKIGQELIFRNRGKRYVLFTVDESIQEGQELDVYQLLQERKKELGLK